ncbi:acetoacetate metabolism transcriptional regulator AtoC [soil metagenome]
MPIEEPVLNQQILVVEDMEDARTTLQQLLKLSLKIPVDVASNGVDALKMLIDTPYSLVITDLRMPKMSGMQMINEIEQRQLPVTVIVTTGHGSIIDAVQAMQQGAYDFLSKPVDPDHLVAMVKRALRERSLQDEVVALRQQLGDRYQFRDVLSKSPKMMSVFDLVSQVAQSNSTVLITGETGTGKEMIARAIHDASGARRSGPLVAVNCAAIPESLIESELFGHEKGSFTGAISQRKGRFEQASGGTLFLDEIGDLPPSMQVKLLRVLQERRIERVGGSEPITIDVRLVSATHRSLEKLVAEGTFREDLYYRLNVIKIELPPLRERPEDIALLANHFVQKYRRPGSIEPTIDPEAMAFLLDAPWPGNVRQLENAIERACVTCREMILRENLPPDIASAVPATPVATVKRSDGVADLSHPLAEQIAEVTRRLEEDFIRTALKKTHGNIGLCADLCGLSRRSITEKLHVYNIDKTQYKTVANDSDE